jgi:hypothetical protein
MGEIPAIAIEHIKPAVYRGPVAAKGAEGKVRRLDNNEIVTVVNDDPDRSIFPGSTVWYLPCAGNKLQIIRVDPPR